MTTPFKLPKSANTLINSINFCCIIFAIAAFPFFAAVSGPMRIGGNITLFPFVVYGIGLAGTVATLTLIARRFYADKPISSWLWAATVPGVVMMLCMAITPMLVECLGMGGACGGPMTTPTANF